MVVLAGSSVQVRSSSRPFNSEATAELIGQGNRLLDKRDYQKARQYYDAAIAHEPTAWGPYVNRALVFIRQRKWDLALQDLNALIRLKPGHLIAALMRGGINEHLGNYSRAIDDYDRVASITASQLSLTCAWALNARAWLRATCPNGSFRNGKQPVADAKRACTSTACGSGCIDTLAAAYAETGDFDSAIRFEQQAISRVDQDELIRLIKDPDRRRGATQNVLASYQHHLAAYERRQPWRSNLD
jgi:tetratricopeptide (TPR) repeat protein